MKVKRWTCGVFLAMSGLLCASGAQAQFPGFSANARLRASASNGFGRYGSLSLYPVAPFATSGRLATGTAGTSTVTGTLIAGDFGFKPSGTQNAYEFGAWYWFRENTDLYEFHTRAYFNPEIGVQLGVLGSTHTSGNAYTAFLLYDLSSRRLAPRSRRRWAVQAGLGLLIDPTDGRTTATGTLFTQLSIEIARNISFNASQWYVRDRSTDLNRFAIGLSYNF